MYESTTTTFSSKMSRQSTDSNNNIEIYNNAGWLPLMLSVVVIPKLRLEVIWRYPLRTLRLLLLCLIMIIPWFDPPIHHIMLSFRNHFVFFVAHIRVKSFFLFVNYYTSLSRVPCSFKHPLPIFHIFGIYRTLYILQPVTVTFNNDNILRLKSFFKSVLVLMFSSFIYGSHLTACPFVLSFADTYSYHIYLFFVC